MDWKRGALRGKHPPFFRPVSQRERLRFTRLPLARFFAGDTTLFSNGVDRQVEGACFWPLNEPPSGLLTLLLRISLGLVGIGTRSRARLFFLDLIVFIFVFLVEYRLIVLLRFFFYKYFFLRRGWRCELDRFRFHVSFNVFRATRVIDDL